MSQERPISKKGLREIEKRLLEIEDEKHRRIHNASENHSWSVEDEIEEDNIKYLDVEKTQLQHRRQFILDRRSSWKAKIIWNIIAPMLVAIITAYITVILSSG